MIRFKSKRIIQALTLAVVVSAFVLLQNVSINAASSGLKSQGKIVSNGEVIFDSEDLKQIDEEIENISSSAANINVRVNDSGQLVFTDSTGTDKVIPF